MQAFNLCRIDNDLEIKNSLMENVGFCSHLFKNPTVVEAGKIKPPIKSGYLGGVNFFEKLSKESNNEIIWLSL